MCAIIGSFDTETFKSLRELNLYRGSRTNSLAVIHSNNEFNLRRGIELLNVFSHENDAYKLGHLQAPTGKHSSIHPAVYEDTMLWHNGIVRRMYNDEWDTLFICKKIYGHAWEALSEIDGSFACVYWDGVDLFIFRNEISPLFIDDKMNISSTKFEGSKSLPPNEVFKVDLNAKCLKNVGKFRTKDNPYYFGD